MGLVQKAIKVMDNEIQANRVIIDDRYSITSAIGKALNDHKVKPYKKFSVIGRLTHMVEGYMVSELTANIAPISYLAKDVELPQSWEEWQEDIINALDIPRHCFKFSILQGVGTMGGGKTYQDFVTYKAIIHWSLVK